ncbi:STAS domain-containing protein [Dactylosporangium roseum]|uniref:Anti-sigma factor antagonist n=1 Tax=Dactylosporangium roseum TaxID=47989 RepID=A0ABY5YW80_9ACTN|nr:STAS domain-containing protein [Dactylosporangium roseum]UWZ33502.1 STAS domain-containing protein [Dactylosporangium roseum]
MARFESRTSVEPGRVVVALAGECDLASREQFTAVLMSAVRTAPVVVVDADELQFLDSSGVHGLVAAHRAAQQEGHRLYLVNAGGVVAHVLQVTGVADLLSPPPSDSARAGHA